MEKKEISISKDTLVGAMAKATANITNKAPKENPMFISSIVLTGALFATELIDILFGGYRPQLMRRVAYDFAR